MSPRDLSDNPKRKKPLAPLQERFLNVGLKGFKDFDIIELLLLSPELTPRSVGSSQDSL